MYKGIWFCRFCGKRYMPEKETERDSFCSNACKMAHHRAYHKYVTLSTDVRGTLKRDHKHG